MPHASDLHGAYTPHNTNKPPPPGWGEKDNSPLNGSVLSTRSIRGEISNLPEVPTTSSQGFWTTRKKILVTVIIVVLLVGAGVGVAVYFLLFSSNTNSSSGDSAAVAGVIGNVTTVATTASTTTIPNPCGSGGTGWNATAITVLGSSVLTSVNGLYLDANNNLYIADEFANSVVWKLLSNTTNASIAAGVFQVRGSNVTQLNYPQDAYVDRNGDLYVTDFFNYRIQKFINGSINGTTIAGITGTAGSSTTQLNGIRFMAFDPTDTFMFVADGSNHRIIRFLTNSTSNTSGVVVAGGVGASNSVTGLNYPWGIHYLPSVSNDLFITNYNGHNVIRWTPGASSGTLVAGVPGTGGQNPVLLNGPMGVRIDNYLNVYVADSGNHRIQMFCANSQTGNPVAGTGIAGSGAGQLNGPRYILFDSAMNMYVSDYGNRRIQKFLKL